MSTDKIFPSYRLVNETNVQKSGKVTNIKLKQEFTRGTQFWEGKSSIGSIILTKSSLNVRSSQMFQVLVSDSKVDSHCIMVSFAAVSPFTAIPVSLAINILQNGSGELHVKWTGIDKGLFFAMVTFCLSNSYCRFKGVVKFNTCVNISDYQLKTFLFFDDMIINFSDMLKINGYPNRFIHDVLKCKRNRVDINGKNGNFFPYRV